MMVMTMTMFKGVICDDDEYNDDSDDDDDGDNA